MNLKPGSNHFSYKEIIHTQDGSRLWCDFVNQIKDIAHQHPSTFSAQVVEENIPADAKNHQLYAYLRDDRTIDAFCIVSISSNQAEFLWSATRRDRRGKGIMTKLYSDIEDLVWAYTKPQVSTIIGMCASLDSSFVSEGDVVKNRKEWHNTHRFHEGLGYTFTYKLEDYWGEGAHAYVFMKLRDERLYGYNPTPDLGFISKIPHVSDDLYPEINRTIQRQIRDYLDVFDEWFIKGVPLENHDVNIQVSSTDSVVKGFTGLALINSATEKATIFAQTSTKPETKRSLKMKFEYDTSSSALTRMFELINDDSPAGIFYYPVSLDKNSELRPTSFFERFYPSTSTAEGYTVLYSKQSGNKDHYSVLYFVTKKIQNVVWYKPLWRSLANYSFALTLEIYSYLESLRILRPELYKSEYLLDLINCVSPGVSQLKDDDIHRKIALSHNAIQARIQDHHLAIVRSKEIAIAHYGHTLGHRLSPIQAFFEGNSESHKRAMVNAKFLGDLSTILQTVTLDSIEALFHHPKKARFLEYQGTNDLLNITQKITEEWPLLAESFQPAKVSSRLVQKRLMTLLEFTEEFPKVLLHYMLTDSENQQSCRPKEAFYSQLFSELLLNIVRYGGIPNDKIDLKKKTARVRVALKIQEMEHNSSIAPNPCCSLTLSNKIGDKTPPLWLNEDKWSLWPSDRENDGPGMGIAILRRLGLGELWYRYNSTKRIFRVAIWLRGLRFEEKCNK